VDEWWKHDQLDSEPMRDEYELVQRVFSGVTGAGWIRACCPMCESKTGKPDKRGGLGYNTRTGGYNCFKCGSTGCLPQNMREELPFTPPDVAFLLQFEPVEVANGYIPLFEEPGLSAQSCEDARAYLRGRGLKDAALAEARVGTGLWGKLRGRVVMPIFDPQTTKIGAWSGWVARDYTGTAERKYLYARAMKRDKMLYNVQALSVVTDRPVYVVEGSLDAISLWPDAVAVLGKPLESQVEILAAAQRPIVVCLDGDAWTEGWALSMKLKLLGCRAGNIRLPPRVDPDEVEREWLDEQARLCLP